MIEQNEIGPSKWYKPKEIAFNGWIVCVGQNPLSHYNFIRKEIANGNLKAQNYARGPKGRSYWRVIGAEVIRYRQQNGYL